MDLSEIPHAAEGVPFKVQKSDLTVHIQFGGYFWSLVHDIPRFYTALLTNLGEFGVTPTSIRSETGENLGAYNVNFWMLNFKINVRIRLERAEFVFNNLTGADVEVGERAFAALMQSLAASNEQFSVSGYQVDWGLHGFAEGVDSREMLSRFVTRTPEGLGDLHGRGAIFYFGKDSVRQSLIMDMSGVVRDAIFFRFIENFDGPPPSEKLGDHWGARLQTALKSVGFRASEG